MSSEFQQSCIGLYKRQSSLYDSAMATISISKARETLSDVVDLAGNEAVFLERHGKSAAVLISPERYEQMLAALEDAEDADAFDTAMSEEGPNIPWEEAKADLGWE